MIICLMIGGPAVIHFDMVQDNKRPPLAEQVAEKINQYILDRNLSPGDRIPNEYELCNQLGVGRGTIREAVKILVARNVLTVQRRNGTFVSERTGEIEDPLGLAYQQDQNALAKDLLELRIQLEPWIAATAAERATDEDIEQMIGQRKKVEDLIEQGINHLEEDKKFHISIANCMHNSVIPKLIPIITFSVSLFGTLSKNSLTNETVIQHRKISDAIQARDPEAARAAMLEHLYSNKRRIEAQEKAE